MQPLAEADLPNLQYLELRVQNEEGFGPEQLQPLASAKLPNLRYQHHSPNTNCNHRRFPQVLAWLLYMLEPRWGIAIDTLPIYYFNP